MPQKLTSTREFGKTGIKVPLVGYGTAPLGKPDVSRQHAVKSLNHAIDAGITYLDTSPSYGSEPHLGEVMKTRRDEVFLATKIDKRSKKKVLEALKESLRKLQTDHVDLIQVHSVSAWADLEEVFAPDGTIVALEQARQEGLVRFIGITGHARPEILAEGLRRYPFDTVLVALGYADHLVSGADKFILPIATELNTGIIAMKVLGHGVFQHRELALRYSLGLPGVSLAIVGMDNPHQVDQIVEIANNFKPLDRDEEDQLLKEVKKLVQKDAEDSQKGRGDLFWLHDTSVMGWSQHDEPALVRY